MKITKSYLKEVILEEIQKELGEGFLGKLKDKFMGKKKPVPAAQEPKEDPMDPNRSGFYGGEYTGAPDADDPRFTNPDGTPKQVFDYSKDSESGKSQGKFDNLSLRDAEALLNKIDTSGRLSAKDREDLKKHINQLKYGSKSLTSMR